MAVKTYRINDEFNASNHMEFLLDSDADVKDLPGLEECAVGSLAMTMAGDFYILAPDGTWKNPFA